MLIVTCAIIIHEGRILGAQRSDDMSLPNKWEFPGGKIEPGENALQCVQREIEEELNIQIRVLGQAPSVFHTYQEVKKMELIPFICHFASGELIVHEHKAIKWCTPEDLLLLDWALADIKVLEWWNTAGKLQEW